MIHWLSVPDASKHILLDRRLETTENHLKAVLEEVQDIRRTRHEIREGLRPEAHPDWLRDRLRFMTLLVADLSADDVR